MGVLVAVLYTASLAKVLGGMGLGTWAQLSSFRQGLVGKLRLLSAHQSYISAASVRPASVSAAALATRMLGFLLHSMKPVRLLG